MASEREGGGHGKRERKESAAEKEVERTSLRETERWRKEGEGKSTVGAESECAPA